MPGGVGPHDGRPSVIIAVIDTGIDYDHADIAANMWANPTEIPGNGLDDDSNGRIDDVRGYDFAYKDGNPMDGNGHGTHVAGTIGAVGNNGIGIAGVNWNCKLMAVKALDDSGSGYDSDLADAITYAADEGAQIINMSWGGPGFSQTVHAALEYAHGLGVILCAAAGNSSSDIASFHPASDNNVITVTASDTTDGACSFTNWGIKAAVSAPGGNGSTAPPPCAVHNCLSLRAGTTDALAGDCGAGVGVVGGNYYRLAGTSMACPHVAGLAGLVKAAHPSWTNEQVRQAIQMRADDILAPGFDKYAGFGRINAKTTLTSAEPMTAFIESPNSGAEVSGVAAIRGTAAGNNLSQWTLDFGFGHEPTTWTTIGTGLSSVVNGTLANWDVTGIPGGLYTLRLRVTGIGMQNAEYRMSITPKSTEGSGHFTELFDSAPFDLAYKSLEFIPDGSDEFYSMCVRPIAQLPTSPSGGSTLALLDDDSVLVSLASGAQVSLYGNVRSQFYVGSNGYITFDSGDNSYSETLSNQFSMKRISALFDDLIRGAGSVTWRQLADHAAVTFVSVSEYGATTQNTFQIELFFDGRIVLSYLNIAASDGLVGLSAGLGVPSGFVESDLSGYPQCVIAGRALSLVKPNGGECYEPGSTARILWAPTGSSWSPSDMVRIECSPDSGSSWSPVPGAGSLAYNAGYFDWLTSGCPQSTHYRIRITFNGDDAVRDASNGDFTVGPDTIPPVISHTPLVDTSRATGSYDVYADVTDNLGVASATLYWNKNDGSFTAVVMNPSGGTGRYVGSIPGPSVVGDRYCYYIEATDSSLAHNVGRLPTQLGQTFCFSIIQQVDYYAQAFISEPFDLQNTSIEFIPDGSNSFYAACAHPISQLPTDPAAGALVPLGDDNFIQINLMYGETVSLYGEAYSGFYVGSNGFVTFEQGDPGWNGALFEHFAFKRISALFTDLYPSDNVTSAQMPDRIAVTFDGVRQYGVANVNTFQIEMFFDGRITLSYLTVESDAGVVGLSAGLGMPEDYVGSDLSAYPCGPRLTVVRPDGGEFYEPGDIATIAWTAVGSDWQGDDTVRLEASADSGANWIQIPGAESLAYDGGSFGWNTSGWAMSSRYRIMVIANRDSAINDASDGDFSIAVDNAPPVITHTPLSDTNDAEGPYRIGATVTDNLGVASVILYWSRNGGSFTPSAMVPAGVNDEYWGDIPGPSANCTDGYCYYMVATDAAGIPNATRSPASGEYCFNVAGPTLDVSTSSMMFGLPPNGTGSEDITLTNNGCVPLEWQIMERAASSSVLFEPYAGQTAEQRPPVNWSAPHVPGRLIVGIKPEVQAAERAAVHAQAGAKAIQRFEFISADVVKVDLGDDLKTVAARYAAMPGVIYVEPDYMVSASGVPNDPLFTDQWGLLNTGQAVGTPDADIDATDAWDITTDSPSVVVAVIDSGVCYTHPDLAANMWTNPGEIPGNGVDDDGNGLVDDVYGYDYANSDGNPMDDYGHGTHVAGIIGAVGDNGIGVAGLSWNVKIMALKFLESDGQGATSKAISCIQYAISKDVTLSCNSWGGSEYSTALYNAIEAARTAGQLFVAAAGNAGVNNDASANYPSSYSHPNIISVAATDRNDNLAVWSTGGGSNWGLNTVDIAAPGLDIMSTVPVANYESWSGTSMSAPYVAGACALCIAANPDATHEQIKHWILTGAEPKPALAGKMVTGGRLNVHNSVVLAGISWLDETPKRGEIPPGESRVVTVSADAAGLDDGFMETARIAIASNDFAHPTTLISVTLNVVRAGRFIRLDSPNGGEWYEPGTVVSVNWTPIGTDWQYSDPVRIDWSADSGLTWSLVPGSEYMYCLDGTFAWNTTGFPPSSKYRLRVVFPNDEGIYDGSDADFSVAADTTPPLITHSPLPDSGDMSGPYTVYAGVTDNYAVGNVTLFWSRNGGSFAAVPMVATETPGQFSGQIPGPSTDGDRYCYYIRAVDASTALNAATDPAGAPAQTYCFITRTVINLPVNLTDGGGFRWDIQQNGSILDGSSDAFDSGFVLSGFPNVSTGGLEDGGREVLISNGATTGIQVSRKIYVPTGNAYCRFLEIVRNLGETASTHTVRLDTNLGSDAATVVAGTSDGDSTFETTDQWIVTDDTLEGSGDPVVTHVIGGAGAVQSPSQVSFTPGFVGYIYDLVLEPQETKIIMHFGVQGQSRTAALGKADQIAGLATAQECLMGMTVDERAHVVNFTIIGRSLRILSPNGGEWYEPGSPLAITWATAGSDWQTGDTVKLESSSDGGATWAPIPGASALAYNTGSFGWNTTGVISSDRYRVRVTWNGGSEITDASDSNFVVSQDNLSPLITHTPLVDNNNLPGPYRVCAVVTDKLGVAGVTLYWSKNGGGFASTPMTPSGQSNEYCADIPGPSVDGDRYCYYIRAIDGSVAGNVSVSPNGAPAQTHCFTVCHVVSLPINLNDSESFLWDIQQNGSILIGSNDAFDGAFVLNGFANQPTGRAEDGDREITINDGASSGIQITRKVYVPSDRAYARFLEIVTNDSSTPAVRTVRIDTNLGSDTETVVVGTSDGDTTLETTDQWIVTDDADGTGDPTITHVIAGMAAPQSPSTVNRSGDTMRYEYVLNLAPNETKIVMHFGVQSPNRASALAKASQLALVDASQNSLFGMTTAERSQVVNFVTSGMYLRVNQPNGGESYIIGDIVPIRWDAVGLDWKSGDTVRIDSSPDNGTTWIPIAGAGSLAYNTGLFNWNTTSVTPSNSYRVRVVRNGDATVNDSSDAGFRIAAVRGTRDCKLYPDGVPVVLNAKRTSAVFADGLYIQEEDRSSGIGVLYDGPTPALGDLATVRGLMVTMDGERMIAADTVTWTDPDALVPIPIGMNNREVGGSALDYQLGPPPTGQKGLLGKAGLNNIGLLVKTWGRVTSVDGAPTFITITDGSGELMVDLVAGATVPAVDDKVSVIGISSCYAVGGDLYSKIRLRDVAGLVIQTGP